MTAIRLYQVDAFSGHVFGGNPAAVCPLQAWLPDALMQAIAAENNLAETAFFVPAADHFDLRWFTPVTEVDLCGHATLATAHVLFNHLNHGGAIVRFQTRSGVLTVQRDGTRLCMDFPALTCPPMESPPLLAQLLSEAPVAVLGGQDLIAVMRDADAVRRFTADGDRLRALPGRGFALTAPGTDCDFVSRAFFPKLGIAEDPATGSLHCQLVPYWSARLRKTQLVARQISARGGLLTCELAEPRVRIGGQAVTYMTGSIRVPD